MTKRTGTISVKTGDILPIIKKWLYSEHDIFIRELVANATDAITKRATIARTKNQEIPTGKIQIHVNRDKKTITISDNGLGMTEQEVEKYIANLAFSGAAEFIDKLKKEGVESNQDIIGKFGLGFYSSFMVADKVEVESLSMEDEAKATKWISEGEEEYTFTDSDKTEVGTTITLYVNEENKEFLDHWKLQETLRNHCDFMPYEVGVLDELAKPVKPLKEDGTIDEEAEARPVEATVVNDTQPLWKKDPKEISEDEYKAFYRKQFPMDGDPLFWIHLKIDHPFTLEGILYFPKINPNKPFQEKNIRLYSKQVFVSDNVKNIIPEFLSLLKGSIDSTDIPLNVSRSSLQGDPNIKRISNYIVKKVAESLKVLFKKDREKYEKIWKDTGLFIKYGAISDTKFDDMMRDKVIFKNSEDKYVTLSEYLDSIPEAHQEKLKDKVIYFEKEKSDHTLREHLLEEKVHCIETDQMIDPHFMQYVETHKQGEQDIRFGSVDSEIENVFTAENTNDDDMKIKDLFTNILAPTKEGEETPLAGTEVEIVKSKNSKSPAYIKVDEQMKRFSQMAMSMGQNNSFPIKKTLIVNPANALVQNAYKIHQKGGNEELVSKICHHVEDLATISSEGLDPEKRAGFIQRSQTLIEELTNLAL